MSFGGAAFGEAGFGEPGTPPGPGSTVVPGGTAAESDAAKAGTVAAGGITVAGGKAAETDSAKAGAAQSGTVISGGTPHETDTAHPGSVDAGGPTTVSGGTAHESDAAKAGAAQVGTSSIIEQDFEGLDLAATLGTTPAGRDAFREIVQDPDFGYLEAQHDHMAVVDNGGTEGYSLRVRFDDGFYDTSADGIAYSPDLPRPVEAARVLFRARFNPGFVSGMGGKFGPGLGWTNEQVGSPSTGGTSNDHAGSFRWMWRDDFRLSPYVYDMQSSGVGLTTSPSSVTAPDDRDWHDYEMDVILNTASVVAGTGTPPSPGTEGVDYLADGTLIMRVDGVEIYSATNRVLRKYADTLLTHLTWSWFRGGSNDDWDVTGGPFYMDLAHYSVLELGVGGSVDPDPGALLVRGFGWSWRMVLTPEVTPPIDTGTEVVPMGVTSTSVPVPALVDGFPS